MISHYRNHLIKLDGDEQLTAEITDLEADALFALKVTASKKEGIEVCLECARELVDVYLNAATSGSCSRSLARLTAVAGLVSCDAHRIDIA